MSLRVLCIFALGLPVFAGSAPPGIHNFYKVDEHVYRGAQPTEEGFRYLAKIGVKTIVDLREPGERGRKEQSVVTTEGMKYVNIPMSGLTAPTETEITRILIMLENNTTGPVFVHCMRGADRTGAVIAAYRIDHDGWENSRALKEALADGMSFFQIPRQHFIRDFRPHVMQAQTNGTKDNVTPPAATIVSTQPAAAITAQ
jgi:tyrosine-protein phosphatase SIW14